MSFELAWPSSAIATTVIEDLLTAAITRQANGVEEAVDILEWGSKAFVVMPAVTADDSTQTTAATVIAF